MSWTRPDEPVGHFFTASEMKSILDQIDSLTAPGWTTYTVNWTSSGTQPAFGNAVQSCVFRQSAGSDLVDVRIAVTFGSTTTFGTGVWFWGLPVVASANEVGHAVGTAYALDTGVQEYGGVVKLENTTTLRMLPASNSTDSANNWGNTTPFTSGSGDTIRAAFRYRVS